jgi:hypothetical protein
VLCTVYLHRLDRAWRTREHGVRVRSADDALVLCATREQAQAAVAWLTTLLAELGLEPKAAKTRIVHLVEGGGGFDFLGFHHRLVRGWTPRSARLTFPARWPHARPPTRPRPGSGDHRPQAAVGAGRGHRQGADQLPARLGRVFPLRELGWGPRPDQQLRPTKGRVAVVQTRQATSSLGLGHAPGAALTRSPGPDPPRWSRHLAQTLPGLAGRTSPVKNVGKPGAGEPHARLTGGTGNRPPPVAPRQSPTPLDRDLAWWHAAAS